MADRKKYVCQICKLSVYFPKKFAKHVMGHAGHTYTRCVTCGLRKRNPDKWDWANKHGCKKNKKNFQLEVFTVTAEALRAMLIDVCGVLPQHIPAPPTPPLVIPAQGGAEGGAEPEEEAGEDSEEEEAGEDSEKEEEEPESVLGSPCPSFELWRDSDKDEEGGKPASDRAPPPPPPVEEEGEARDGSFSTEYAESNHTPDPESDAERDGDPKPDPEVDPNPLPVPVPTLPMGHCLQMDSTSLDYRARYPVGVVPCRNIQTAVNLYLPSPQAAIVQGPQGHDVIRVPAVHRRTGTYVILTAPVWIREVGLIFRDCTEFDPVPTALPCIDGWLGAGEHSLVETAATWYQPLPQPK